MPETLDRMLEFYRVHPISAEHILGKLTKERGNLDNVRPDELLPHDQDHYGGLEANEALARSAAMSDGKKVADFCAGLAGPARYYASRYGVEVTAIDLSPNRVEGAKQLNSLVGLDRQITVLAGDVRDTDLPADGFDAVVSQESFLHVPDKARVLSEAYRVLKPGGRLAFTDWIVHRTLPADHAALMWEGMAAQSLQTLASYQKLLADTGFIDISAEDLTTEWADILQKRFAMYKKLREEAARAGNPSGDDSFYRAYVTFVDDVKNRVMGGGRFAATKPAEG